LDGGHMAVGQAVDAFRYITGLEPDPARMRGHFLVLLAQGL
ncbi:MAG TPA: shikimate dehydrogenase, partial [Arthrobacter sp.]|nr:shikimate dehydrogenase [Arthrobacter sp.]